MTIDNFDLFRPYLTFELAQRVNSKTGKTERLNASYDRYIVHIIRRAKDAKGRDYGVNETNRVIKTFEIDGLSYFDAKRPVIMDICNATGARAYILPQVRSVHDCMKNLIARGIENLDNPSVKIQNMVRSCLTAVHTSRDKKWVLDLDADNLSEPFVTVQDIFTQDQSLKTWTVKEVLALVQDELEALGKSKSEAFIVPTRSGHHIVTSPFNQASAFLKCSLLFEGERNGKIGWIHRDGMSLLYMHTDD